MKEISVQELRDILTKKERHSIVIDVRTPEEHSEVHIHGVANMPLDEIEKHADELRTYDAVYIHCKSGGRSGQACQQLEALGLANTVNVKGGIGEWEQCGFEVCRGKHSRIPVMQQVLLVSGVLVLSGLMLSRSAHPYFIALPIIAGVGMTFAGITGICLMRLLLLKMPWNR